MPDSSRKLRRQLPIRSRQGLPCRSTCRRLPTRTPNSANRLTQVGSPAISSTSAQPPASTSSKGSKVGECTNYSLQDDACSRTKLIETESQSTLTDGRGLSSTFSENPRYSADRSVFAHRRGFKSFLDRYCWEKSRQAPFRCGAVFWAAAISRHDIEYLSEHRRTRRRAHGVWTTNPVDRDT
jgi:hypothetical protein